MKKKFICLTALLILICMMLSSCIADMFGDIGVTQPPESSKRPGADSTASADETTGKDEPVFGSKPDYSALKLDEFIKVEYKGLSFTSDWLPPEITDKVIAANLNGLIDYYVTNDKTFSCDSTVEKEGVVEEWDFVEISFVGKMNGEVFEGGSSTENGWMLVNDHDSGFIPGFASGVIGAEIGKMKEVNVTFPDDYNEALAGKEAVFEITVHSRKNYTLTDAVAEKITGGDYKTADSFITYYKGYLEELYESDLLSLISGSIFEEIKKNSTVYSYPNEQFLYYYNSNVSYMTLQAEKLGLSYEDYMTATGENDDTLRQKAKDSVLEDMAIYYILEKEGKTMTDEEYNEALDYYVDYYNSMGYTYDRKSIEAMFEYYYYPGYLRYQFNKERAIKIVFDAGNTTLSEAK